MSPTRPARIAGAESRRGAVTPTLTAGEGNLILIDKIMEKTERKPRPEGKGWCWDEESGKWFRIRKLTPRECFRLMDCKESDIDKLLSTEINKKGEEVQVISNSQLYKCAGNSIVVACMYEMFKNLFYPEVAVKETLTDEGVQLSLF